MAAGSSCWLCNFAGSPEEAKLTKFCVDNAGTMTPAQMAIVVHEALLDIAPGEAGIKVDDVLVHLTNHSLHPSIQVACILRKLLDVMDKVSGTIVTPDSEGDGLVVDGKNVQVYLKVVAEVMSLYRTGESSRLLFSESKRRRLEEPSGRPMDD